MTPKGAATCFFPNGNAQYSTGLKRSALPGDFQSAEELSKRAILNSLFHLLAAAPENSDLAQAEHSHRPHLRKTKDRVTTDANFESQVYQAEADPSTYQLGEQQGSNHYVLLGVNRD